MDLKKLTGKLMTVVAAGAMVMSIGGDLEYIDEVTLLRALEGRTEI